MALIKQVVPWFDKKEWETVYNLVYSMNPDLQRNAYQHITIWRARTTRLCMGVECTQALLHLYLCESKSLNRDAPAFEDIDLQPIYCTAIMRFLNHLQGLCDSNRTLYQIAAMYKIPDWIVNMRHETAHGNKLPPLFLLRDAANFIFEWLNRNYWQVELEKMKDVIVHSSTVVDRKILEAKIEKLLRLWKCIQLYHLGGYKRIDDIPNTDCLRSELDYVTIMCGNDESTIKHELTIETLKYILKHLFFIFEVKDINRDMAETILISKLLSNEYFLPSVSSLKKNACNKSVIVFLMNIWKDVLLKIEAHDVMLNLVQALYTISSDSSDHRHYPAALWMQCLLSSLVDSYTHKRMKLKESLELLTEKLSCPFCSPETVQGIIKHTAKWMTQMIPLKKITYLKKHAVQKFVRHVLYNPSENTLLYIFSLLDLWEPPLKPSSKQELSKLVKLYTKGASSLLDDGDDDGEIKTVEMLKKNFDCSHVFVECFDETYKEDCDKSASVNCDIEGNWSLYEGDEEDWSACALGTIPGKSLPLRS